MQLDLRDIIYVPGASAPFEYEPDLSEAVGGSIVAVRPGASASGRVRNSAGVLHFDADVEAVLECTCARCLKVFELPVHRSVHAVLSEGENEDDPDVYTLCGDNVDVDEIILTDFILNMDQRLLCREDCEGLCEKCGSDLNDGPCHCKSETDPRLAVLGQLLENE
ncbi:MAG TPA: DUF177 domain-containing protein [Papillibacter sp.]|jgi:uncharacterized protein|nr:DUF177 domain-containing protein [Papillibacter sp.]